MNIVYTTENPKLKTLGEIFNSPGFVRFLHDNAKAMSNYEYGMNRVQPYLVKEHLNRYLEKEGMFITDETTHAHNIGNNNSSFVLDIETQERFARISLNSDGFGACYCYATDINENKISNTYELHSMGPKIHSAYTPDWSSYPLRNAHPQAKDLNGKEPVEKIATLTIRTPAGFDHKDKRKLDDAFAELLRKWGCELINSKPLYESVPMFVFDDELLVGDKAFECIDGCLIATDSLIARVIDHIRPDYTPDIIASMENFYFYIWCNVQDGSMGIDCLFDYYAGREMRGSVKLPLSDIDVLELKDLMESYCEKQYHMSCLAFVNEARTHEGLSALEPIRDPGQESELSPSDLACLDNMLQGARGKATHGKEPADEKSHIPTR